MFTQEVCVEDVLFSDGANSTQRQEGQTVKVGQISIQSTFIWHTDITIARSMPLAELLWIPSCMHISSLSLSYGVGNQSVLHFIKRLKDKNRK